MRIIHWTRKQSPQTHRFPFLHFPHAMFPALTNGGLLELSLVAVLLGY